MTTSPRPSLKVLVTGHLGYIGTVLVDLLHAAGHQVVGLDTGFFEACQLHPPSASVAVDIPKDIRDIETADVEGLDAVCHLAALSNDPIGELNPELTCDINHRATVRLAELCRTAGVRRFLFSSSCSMYGASTQELVDEQAALNPLTAYAESKVRTEERLRELADQRFSPVFLRNATAYGVSPRLRVDLVLNNLVGWACTTGCIRIMSDGTPWRPIVHVEDIGRAFLAVLTAPREAVHNEAFNVGVSADNYQVRDLAEIVRQTVPGCRIEYAGNASPDARSYRVDFRKIQQQLPEFRPQWDACRGASQLYDAYRRARLDQATFESATFIRLKQLQKLLAEGNLDEGLRWVRLPGGAFQR